MKKALIATSALAAVLAIVAPVDSASARDGSKDRVESRHYTYRRDKSRHDEHRRHDRHRHDRYGHRDRHDGRYGDHRCYRPDYQASRWCGTGWCNQPHTIRPGLLWNGTFYFD